MNKHDFLRAICDQPGNDSLRLIYADWLEEYGDASDAARASYIRLAIEKSRLRHSVEGRKELQQQMNVLVKAHRREWFPPSPLVQKGTRSRGFIWYARGSADCFNEHADALFAREPVTKLCLEPSEGHKGFDQFAANPLLRRLRGINLTQGSIPPGGFGTLAASGNLINVDKLELGSLPLRREDFDAVGRVSWPNLRSLYFLRCGLDGYAMARLAELQLPKLNVFRLAVERIDAEGLRHLRSAPWLGQLRQLDLAEMQGLSSDSVAELLEDRRLQNLRRLKLDNTPLGIDGLRRLSQIPHFGNVKNLDLGYTRGQAAGLMELFHARSLQGLRSLYFGSNGVTFTDEIGRPSGGSWPALRLLYLGGNPLTDRCITRMLRDGTLRGVCQLFLSHARLTSASLGTLVRSPARRYLTVLWIGANPLGPPENLPQVVHLPRLRSFNADRSELTDRAAARLVRAMRAPDMRELCLDHNGLSTETAHAVATNPSFGKLYRLSLGENPAIDDEAARILAESLYLNGLQQLDVFHTSISDAGLALLRKRFPRVG